MKKKIVIYTTGERYIMDGLTLSLHQGAVRQEIDLTEATDQEIQQLKENPNNDELLQTIQQRKKVVR